MTKVTNEDREWWAEQADLSTLDKPGPWMDGDGQANLYYYDEPRLLAFHWNGDASQPVEVSYGGDHEPPRWEFDFMQHREPRLIIAGTRSMVLAFQYACDRWVEAKEDAR